MVQLETFIQRVIVERNNILVQESSHSQRTCPWNHISFIFLSFFLFCFSFLFLRWCKSFPQGYLLTRDVRSISQNKSHPLFFISIVISCKLWSTEDALFTSHGSYSNYQLSHQECRRTANNRRQKNWKIFAVLLQSRNYLAFSSRNYRRCSKE